jgi:iron complex outermembrane receptor protein
MYGAAPDASFFNSTAAWYRIKGMELTGSLTPVAGLELFAGAAWLRAEAKGDDGVKQKKMPYTPGFAFQSGFRWKFLDHFQLSGDYQHSRDVYAATAARAANPAAPQSTFAKLDNANKLPDMHVVNLRLDYLFNYAPMHIKEGKLFLAVNNVLDAEYAYALETDGENKACYYMPGTTFMAGFELKF